MLQNNNIHYKSILLYLKKILYIIVKSSNQKIQEYITYILK